MIEPKQEMIERCRLLMGYYGNKTALLVMDKADAERWGLSSISSVPKKFQVAGIVHLLVEIPAHLALERLSKQ